MNETNLTVIDGENLRNIKRHTDVFYSASDESDVSDESTLGGKSCVPYVPCDPVGEREAISARSANIFAYETEKYPTAG